jgi:hypothetical protein
MDVRLLHVLIVVQYFSDESGRYVDAFGDDRLVELCDLGMIKSIGRDVYLITEKGYTEIYKEMHDVVED